MIKMTQDVEPKETVGIDKRIPMGQAIERLKKYPEFEVFLSEVSKLRDMAKYDFMANGNSKNCGEWLRSRLHTLDEVMGIPEEIIMKMRIAVHEAQNDD